MSRFKKFIVPALLIIISLFSVWVTVTHFSDGVVEEYDALIMVWEMNQTINKIPHNLRSIFQGNIFYPFENTLAFTHLLIPSALLSYIPVKLTGSFVAASNFTLIFGQIATALILYYWLKDISGNRLSSFIGTVALIVSKIRLNFFVHLQMWTMHWWLLPSWLFWRFFKYKKLKYLYTGFVLMGIVIWENVLPLYFVATILFALIIVNFRLFKKYLWHFVAGGVLAIFIMSPVLRIYRQVSVMHGFERTIRDAAHFSSGIDELATKSFAPSIFLLLGLSLFKLGSDKNVVSKYTKWIFVVFLVSFTFTLGPVVKWAGETVKLFGKIPIPLPYSLFYYIVPGLNALRATSRWLLLSAFSVVILFSYAFRDINIKKNILVVTILVLLTFLDVNRIDVIYPIPERNEIPEVYQWLSATNYASVLELPMYTWTDKQLKKHEYLRLYYSLFHKKRMVNGVSGFAPKETGQLLVDSRKADSIDQISERLKFFSPDLIIIHKDQQRELLGREILLGNLSKNLVREDDSTFVIKLEQP